MAENRYTIKELSELIGYPIRTIRYYIQEGLLEPPAGRGRGGFYFDSHLDQLRRLRGLQEKGMKLTTIKEYLKEGEFEETRFSRFLWVRYEIIPGLEINVRRDLEEKKGRKVLEIIKMAKSIAEEVHENDR